MNILVTGAPGIGKTTVVEKLAGLIERPAGFVTTEIRRDGLRSGFAVRAFDGGEAVLARRDESPGPRVGPYRVLFEGLEDIGVASIDVGIEEGRVILIDEIGKMEAKSPAFRSAVLRALESRNDVVATIGVSREPFLRSVRVRGDVSLVEITRANRGDMPARLKKMLESGR